MKEPEMIGRREELSLLRGKLERALAGEGGTLFVAGEAGVGKTRLISELMDEAEKGGVQMIKGWCLAENLEPLMPVREALRNSGLYHLIAGQPPPRVISAYLTDVGGLLAAKVERQTSDLDPDIFASMLTGVGNFVKDSLSAMGKEGEGLNSIGYGDFTIIMQRQTSASLACVIEGMPSEFLIEDMQRILHSLGSRLDHWEGTEKEVSDLEDKISRLVTSGKYDGKFPVDDPKLKQENLFDNVLMGVQRASHEDLLIIFIDDLQWADRTTLNLLHYLARNTRNHRVLILGTYRPEDIIKAKEKGAHQLKITMQNMSRENLLEKIELRRLDTRETNEILRSTLDDAVLEDDFTDKIHKETEGNPFFLLEVIKLLVEEGYIQRDAHGEWVLSADIKDMDVPSRVYDVIKRRLDRLMADQREILECASIEGVEFRSKVIGRVLEINRLKLLRNLSDIEKTHRLIHSRPNRYRFDHTKITEVLYNGMIYDLRREYHSIVGDTIAELYKEEPDEVVNELAHHYYKAGDERAAGYLLKAGNRAKDGYANDEAVTLYTKALEVTGPREKLKILENLGDVLSLMGEYEKAIVQFRKARGSTDDDAVAARMLRKVAEVYAKKGEYDSSLDTLSGAKRLISDKNTAEYARILFGEGYTRTRKGDYDAAMLIFREVVTIFSETVADQKDMGNALRAIGNTYLSKGLFREALEHYENSLVVMKKIDDRFGIAAVLGNIGIVYWGMGELDKSLKYYEESLEIREDIGDKQGIAFSRLNIGGVYSAKGNLGKALEFYEQSLEMHEKMGDKHGVAMSLIGVGEMRYHMGEEKDALGFYNRGLEICLEIGEKRVLIYNYCNIAEAELRIGNVQTSLENAEKALATASDIGAKSQEAMSRRVLGMVHREAGNWDKATRQFELAGEILRGGGDRDEPAKLHYEYGILWKAKGDIEMSGEYIKKALFEFEEMGMTFWVKKCQELL